MHSGDFGIFDTHCDTLDFLLEGRSLQDKALHFSISAAKQYKKYVQVMAYCVYGDRSVHPFQRAVQGIKALSDYPIIRTVDDLLLGENQVRFLIGVEGGEALEASLDNLRLFYEKGVRVLTLTWNRSNDISDAAAETQTPGGLTAFGTKLIPEMERLGIAVDVSHISEKGFWDVLKVARKPIIASHSCAKELCTHQRNLTDEQFVALCKNGGVVGVNFYPLFLGGNSIENVANHIFHFLSLGGEEHIGFGSDFDGIPDLPVGISGVSDVYKIVDFLLQKNLPEHIVHKIAYTNMEKYFIKTLPRT